MTALTREALYFPRRHEWYLEEARSPPVSWQKSCSLASAWRRLSLSGSEYPIRSPAGALLKSPISCSAESINTLPFEFRWAVSTQQQSSWTRERYRVPPSPPSCLTSSLMPSFDSSTLLAFPIVYEESPIGIIKPLPMISLFTSAQRTMPILCWIL